MSELEITDAEAGAWLSGQLEFPKAGTSERDRAARRRFDGRPRSRSPLRANRSGHLHLLLGDSIARRSGLKSADAADGVFCRATGGATWQIVVQRLSTDLQKWRSAASASGMALGSVAIWLSSNDVYSRFSGLPTTDRSQLSEVVGTVREAINLIKEVTDSHIYILGPLPRPSGELMGATWESTAAYHLERSLLREALSNGVTLIKLGRALTRKISHKRAGLCEGCLPWFQDDRVHLSRAGYRKLAPLLPKWLRVPDE